MTERELLEMAAKAEGTVTQDASIECVFRGGPVFLRPFRGFNYQWDPLIDDADAFRLAVKLKLDLRFPQDNDMYVDAGDCDAYTVYLIDTQGNRDAATRRAIVRAAAEIGRSM